MGIWAPTKGKLVLKEGAAEPESVQSFLPEQKAKGPSPAPEAWGLP